jgi:hypothetical protein
MPFAEGESLRQRLGREGPLPLDVALQITREVGSALTWPTMSPGSSELIPVTSTPGTTVPATSVKREPAGVSVPGTVASFAFPARLRKSCCRSEMLLSPADGCIARVMESPKLSRRCSAEPVSGPNASDPLAGCCSRTDCPNPPATTGLLRAASNACWRPSDANSLPLTPAT